MPNNFITNSKDQKTLKERLNTLIGISDELKFLVGFFYFSGWSDIYEGLRKNPQQKIKLLVGLQVCNHLGSITEYAEKRDHVASQDEEFQKYLESLGFALNNAEMDTEEFYRQAGFFVHLIEQERLEIRKTEKPNHAKLYLFCFDEEHSKVIKQEFITGSSNLTRSGLHGQEEFNVEIRDYGTEDAVQYFDDLWERAIPITENPKNRTKLIDFIQNRTQVAHITPFEAYCLTIKTYLDLQNTETEKVDFENLLDKVGFKNFSYQTDAVKDAIQRINEHNGCIIADVVGLGKSVIASMVARQMNKRGIVICPPALMGDAEKRDSGWWEYLEKFGLHNWLVHSRGKMDEENVKRIQEKNFEVVIVDEAHYFRNQDTVNYEALWTICRNKKVILLSATPFNNSPADIFSLLKLFVVPGKSSISLEDDLAGKFGHLNFVYKQLSHIFKHWNNTDDSEKRKKAESYYTILVDEKLPIDIKKVRKRTRELSKEIKRIIGPVVIRRNRLDLKKDKQYAKEIGDLSVVRDPEEVFYYLDEEQNAFYDKVIKKYFTSQKGAFKGAVYQPFRYQKILEDKLDKSENRRYQQQENMYGFMLRILVKRFESSFASFKESVDRVLEMHRMVRDFIDKTGKFVLDRNFIEKIRDEEDYEIEANLHKYAVGELDCKTTKNTEVYDINAFQRKQEFLDDIDSDICLFEKIQKRLEELKLVEKDPKQEEIVQKIKNLLKNDPDRKIILFSEYVDTIRHLEKRFRQEFGNELLVCDGKMSKELAKNLNRDFNAQYSGSQTDHFKILLTSDKLSEGFNLNRAGVIINYDIPWNPTRVIQRVGRINRIGMKVFDELFILNFFPSLKGADVLKSREIAQQKMFLIHNTLGEDAKIFDGDEEPTPSALGAKINGNPEGEGELNTITKIRNIYDELQSKHPETIAKINQLPHRVKTAKQHPEYGLNVLRRKGTSLFAQTISENKKVREIDFEELLQHIECTTDEPTLRLSSYFWGLYEELQKFKPTYNINRNENALEQKAIESLRMSQKIIKDLKDDERSFIQLLIKDLRNYHTLPSHSIRRVAELSDSEASINAFRDGIKYLKDQLGENYIHDIELRIKDRNKEVIIAVENNDMGKLF